MKAPTVKQVLDRIDLMAPRALALPGDPVGLQCGDPHQPATGIMLALDASGTTVSQAVEARADLLVTHHPLLFEPLGPGTINGPGGRAYTKAVRSGLVVFSAHTNLDASPLGVNAAVASLFPLLETRPLQGTGPRPYKVVVFTPAATQEKIRRAVFEAGGGRIGAYSGCSFAAEGQGTFVPGEGSRPHLGQAGQAERVHEARQEFAVDGSALARVLEAVGKAHPYEEPVVDVYPLEAVSSRSGLGIAGVLEKRVSVGTLAERLVLALRTRTMRLVGKRGRKVRRVAVCAGSGASLMDLAAEAGAELYVTGDVKYHDARKAEDLGMALLDVGHFAAERYGFHRFGEVLEKDLVSQGWGIRVLYARESDPLGPVPS